MNRFNRIDAENEQLRELVSKAEYFFDFILHFFVFYKRNYLKKNRWAPVMVNFYRSSLLVEQTTYIGFVVSIIDAE